MSTKFAPVHPESYYGRGFKSRLASVNTAWRRTSVSIPVASMRLCMEDAPSRRIQRYGFRATSVCRSGTSRISRTRTISRCQKDRLEGRLKKDEVRVFDGAALLPAPA